jgi:hypothetical protein
VTFENTPRAKTTINSLELKQLFITTPKLKNNRYQNTKALGGTKTFSANALPPASKPMPIV